jgi:hypothetical protein
MKNKITLILACACALACGGAAFAARSDVGTSGAVFLKLAAGARPAAMGEAFAGIADDVNALFYNPAGSAFLEKPQFTAQYGSWFQGIAYNVLGFTYPAGNAGSFGLGIINLGVNDIEKRTADTETPDSKFAASDYAYMLHYSRKLRSDLSAGVNVKLVSQKIDTVSATAYGADLGVFWVTPVERLTCGLVAQNLGTQVKFVNEGDPLPLVIKAGAGYKMPAWGVYELTAGLDVNMPRDNDIQYAAGGELKRSFSQELSCALRAGYKTVAQEKLGGLSGLTAGVGMSWRQFGVDFAWVPYGDLGDTYRYSMVAKF